MIGLAVGDAVGTSVEFKSKDSFPPVTDMTGGGPFELKAGQWTDDTSMALCLMDSLCRIKGFDLKDQIETYIKWYQSGYMSSTGTCFDIGNTVRSALLNYGFTNNPKSGSKDAYSAGNGSLMRLAPVPIYYRDSLEQAISFSGLSSVTTHGCQECVDSCKYYGALIWMALHGHSKDEVLSVSILNKIEGFNDSLKLSPKVRDIAQGFYKKKPRSKIFGTGYVIAAMEAALWCFYNSENFRDGCLLATNLGDDADTTAAIYGQLAGAYYGIENLPLDWKHNLHQYEMIVSMTLSLLEAPTNSSEDG